LTQESGERYRGVEKKVVIFKVLGEYYADLQYIETVFINENFLLISERSGIQHIW
jgi:hypothetical protein